MHRGTIWAWKPHIGGGTPRDFGPCGDVLDRNTPLMFHHIERRYEYFLPVTPPVEECLLVPFYVRVCSRTTELPEFANDLFDQPVASDGNVPELSGLRTKTTSCFAAVIQRLLECGDYR